MKPNKPLKRKTVNIRIYADTRNRFKIMAAQYNKNMMEFIDDASRTLSQ